MPSTTHSNTAKDCDTASIASNSTFASTITLIKEKMHRSQKIPKSPKAPKASKASKASTIPKDQPHDRLLLADVATGAHRTRMLLPTTHYWMLMGA